MKHEGPHPDEALPVGEEPLSPEELDKLAAVMIELEEIAIKHFPDRITEADVTPEQWDVIQQVKTNLQSRVIDSLKQVLIDQRD